MIIQNQLKINLFNHFYKVIKPNIYERIYSKIPNKQVKHHQVPRLLWDVKGQVRKWQSYGGII